VVLSDSNPLVLSDPPTPQGFLLLLVLLLLLSLLLLMMEGSAAEARAGIAKLGLARFNGESIAGL
jgi:hypothetical protein